MSDDFVPPVPPRTFLDSLKDWWPYLTGIVIAAWAVWIYSSDHRKIAEDRRIEAERISEARLFEARKPFLELQLKLMVELSEIIRDLIDAAGRSGADPNYAALISAEDRMRSLYWSKLRMVADEKVLVAVGALLAIFDQQMLNKNIDVHALRDATQAVASQLQESIKSTWALKPPR